MKKEMLINVLQPEECRIAIVEDGVLEELYVERTSQESYVGNIYKGRIVNIEPSIQAAFVDFGIGRNGFLHVCDVEPAYYRHLEPGRSENGGRRNHRGKPRPASSSVPAPEQLVDRFPESEPVSTEAARDMETFVEGSATEEPEEVKGRRSSKGRGRSRGRGRRRQAESPQEAPGPAPQTESPAARSDDTSFSIPEAEKPFRQSEADQQPSIEPSQFMGSAEHRTEENTGAREQTKPAPTINDDDIFFPRSEPSSAPTVSPIEPEMAERVQSDLSPDSPANDPSTLAGADEDVDYFFEEQEEIPSSEAIHSEEGSLFEGEKHPNQGPPLSFEQDTESPKENGAMANFEEEHQ